MLDYRITGTPANVRTALEYAGFQDADINKAIAGAVTRDNVDTTMKAAYDAEIARHAALRRDKPAVEGYGFEQLLWFAQNLKSAKIGTKAGETRGVVTGGKGGGGDSLAEKLRKLGPGKVLDVSNMDLATGKGVRSIPAPKTDKSGKFGTTRLPIISNKIDQYVRALELAYGVEAVRTYDADIQQVRQALRGAPPAVPRAGAARVPSPPRVG
ncbi:MAG: hypothetical protein ABIQ41_02005, partial [Gemmatimonadales bacterium]